MAFIGIDIGTNSIKMSSYKKDVGFEAIPNHLGSFTTPTCLAWSENDVQIG